MKSNIFVLIGLVILILFSISAISASDNSTDDISISEDVTEEISISDDASEDLSASEDAGKEISISEDAADNDLLESSYTLPDEFGIKEKLYEGGNDDVVYIYSSKKLSGNITISINGKECFNKDIKTCLEKDEDGDYQIYKIKQKDLSLQDKGKYKLDLKFNKIAKSQTVQVCNIIEIYEAVAEKDDPLFYINHNLKGTVKLFINGKEYRSKKTRKDLSGCYYLNDFEVPKNMKYGTYNVKVVYTTDQKTYTNEKKVKYSYPFYIESYVKTNAQVYPKAKFSAEITFKIHLPKDAGKKVKLKFNGKTYKLTPKNGKATLKVKVSALSDYTVSASYSDSKYPLQKVKKTVEIYPHITWPSSMSEGEDQYINFVAPKGAKGTVELYEGKWVRDVDGEQWYEATKKIATVKIVDGVAKIPLKKLSKGYHKLSLKYTIGGFTSTVVPDTEDSVINIQVNKNSQGFKASVKPTAINAGGKIKIKLTGPKTSKKASIYLDDKKYGDYSLKSGKISKTIKKLSAGSHSITIRFDHSKKYFSKTFHIDAKKTPKIFLKFKKAEVKKSAKRTAITAVLKLKGKKAKGEKLNFKFNGKKYSAKTNKKGIAKITIKKSELKKLKVGESVTLQVKYKKVAVKKNVVVQ